MFTSAIPHAMYGDAIHDTTTSIQEEMHAHQQHDVTHSEGSRSSGHDLIQLFGMVSRRLQWVWCSTGGWHLRVSWSEGRYLGWSLLLDEWYE